jgi:hypothetical protein
MPHVLSISLFSITLKYLARSTNLEASHYICFFSIVSLLPVKSKYSLWYPVLMLPEFMFFAQCERLQILHSYIPVAKILDLHILMLHVIHTLVVLLYLLSFYKSTWISAGNITGNCQHCGTVGLKWCGKAVPVLDLCLAFRVIYYRTLLQRWPEVGHRILIQRMVSLIPVWSVQVFRLRDLGWNSLSLLEIILWEREESQPYSSELMLSCKCHFLTIIPITTPINGERYQATHCTVHSEITFCTLEWSCSGRWVYLIEQGAAES